MRPAAAIRLAADALYCDWMIATPPLVLTQRHPRLGIVSAACSYVPDFFPIWGNAITFSREPFCERMVAGTARFPT